MDLSVITVTYHSKDYIEDLIFSVMMSCFAITHEHIIVDNASQDGTAELIEERFAGRVRLIKNQENVGFSKANNQALRMAKGRYILFLNPDMCVKEGDFDQYIRWMDENPKVGLSGCRLLNPLGKKYSKDCSRSFPHPRLAILWLLRLHSFFDTNQLELSDREPQEVEFIKGAFLLLRREVLERLGWGFDPRYFILFEDTDLCREVRKLGFKNMHYPHMTCVDYLSRSFLTKSSQWIYLELTKSMLRYFRKWHPWHQWIWVACAIPLGYLIRFYSIKKLIKK